MGAAGSTGAERRQGGGQTSRQATACTHQAAAAVALCLVQGKCTHTHLQHLLGHVELCDLLLCSMKPRRRILIHTSRHPALSRSDRTASASHARMPAMFHRQRHLPASVRFICSPVT